MFNLFSGISAENFNQSNQAHAVNWLALAIVLVEKGILSVDEFEKARVKATHLVEQEFAKKRDAVCSSAGE